MQARVCKKMAIQPRSPLVPNRVRTDEIQKNNDLLKGVRHSGPVIQAHDVQATLRACAFQAKF